MNMKHKNKLAVCIYNIYNKAVCYREVQNYVCQGWALSSSRQVQSHGVRCHHGVARPQGAGGRNSNQIMRGAANILTTQERTAEKGWSSSLGIGPGS